MEDRFNVGYDEGEIDGEMWVQPNRVLGKMMLLNETPNSVEILIDMRVEPKRLPSWNVKGVMTIAAAENGIRATKVQDDIWEQYRRGGGPAVDGSAHEEPVTGQTPTAPVVVDIAPPPLPAMEPIDQDGPSGWRPRRRCARERKDCCGPVGRQGVWTGVSLPIRCQRYVRVFESARRVLARDALRGLYVRRQRAGDAH